MKVLFVVTDTGTGACTTALIPLLQEVRKHKAIEAKVVVDNTYTHNKVLQAGFNAEYKHSKTLSERLIGFRFSLYLRGRVGSFMRGSRECVQLQRLLSRSTCSEIVRRINWLSSVFMDFKPDVVVVFPAESWLGKIACRLSMMHNVPSVTFYQSLVSTHPMYTADLTNYVFAYGEQCSEMLIAHGIPSDHIILTGNPKFDSLPVVEDHSVHVRPILLVATHLIVDGAKEWLTAFLQQFSIVHDAKVIIKPHPDDQIEEYEEILRPYLPASWVTVETAIPLYTLITLSDVVLVDQSMVGSEAALIGKPLVCINLTGNPYVLQYDKEGVALLVTSEQEIVPAIHKALYDHDARLKLREAREHFIRRYAWKLDGQSSERFVEAIEKVTRK